MRRERRLFFISRRFSNALACRRAIVDSKMEMKP